MNPWPVASAALRRSWRSALAMVLLVAVATGLGTGIGAFERASRRAAARAADAFDLVVGAPGGAMQLVLAAVYLQPDAIPLLDPAVAQRVLAEPDLLWASPIGFGDSWRGHPVVGVGPAFIARGGGGLALEGRSFGAEEEAVAGASVPLRMGDGFSPLHGAVELPDGHVHEEIRYRIVGRLRPTGTPWDNAILVPIESVWELHGLGNGHLPGVERVGPPWERPAGVPAIVVKPRTIAGAYQLRARYRAGGSTAVFPGEVLAQLFRTLGDVRAVLSAMASATAALVVSAVFLAYCALLGARQREWGVLRALGASPGYVMAALWLEIGAVLCVGVAAGTLTGWAGAAWAGAALGRSTGVAVPVSLGWPELRLACVTLGAALAAAVLPAILGLRVPPAAALKR